MPSDGSGATGGRHRRPRSEPPVPGAAIRPLRAAALVVMAACGTAGSPTDDTADTALAEAAHLGNANNYHFEGLLDLPSTPVRATADIAVSWASLALDVQCHAVDPVADIDNVSLMAFPRLGEAEVEAGLSRDSLQQVDMGVYLSWEPGDATEAHLSDLTFGGTDPEIEAQFTEGSGTWLLLFTTGTQVGVGARALAFVEPRADVDTERVEVTDGCDVLEHTVDLDELEPLALPAAAPWSVEWSTLTVTGQGTPLVATKVSSVMVARFDTTDLAALEADFLDLELIAAQTWSAPHPGGVAIDLADLRDDAGEPFPGVDSEGTWLLALRCESCPVPAPLALTRLLPG